MQTLYPGAQWRPLGVQTEPSIGVPRLFIFHTMDGYLHGTEEMFRRNGYGGTESHFGLGGPYDGTSLDGVLYQWQTIDHQADTQFDPANGWATSVETSDGGRQSIVWSPKQVEALVNLGVWWCRQTGQPPVIAASYNGRGFGWHSKFPEWNKDAHNCPGSPRVNQVINYIVPEIGRRLHVTHPSFPTFPLGHGEWFGPGDVMAGHGLALYQNQMNHRGWTITVDGVYGQQTKAVTEAFQNEKGLTVDGLIGVKTWDAAWLSPVTK